MVYGMNTKRLLLSCLALIPALTLAKPPTASAQTPTISLSGPVTVSAGGTGASSLAANGVLIGEGTAAFDSVILGADTLLQGQGSGIDPAAVAVPNCAASGDALNYSTTTHAFSCQTIPQGGTMTVVASDETRSTGGSGDTYLRFLNQPAGSYALECYINATGNAFTGFALEVYAGGTLTTGASGWTVIPTSGSPQNLNIAVNSFNTTAANSANASILVSADVVTSTTGNITFVWGAAVTGNSLTVHQGSWCRLTAT